jgi:phosphate transport system substrate-binding protein
VHTAALHDGPFERPMIRLPRDWRQPVCALLLGCVGPWAVAAGSVVHGAGATFPFPVYARWAEAYRSETGVDVRYAPVGSGAGVLQLERKTVDFGASDMPLAAPELESFGLLQFPAIIGGVVPVVNITGIKPGDLRLSGQVLADIYLGNIRKWNEPAIAELNPDLDLPDENITVVHRADASGTTFLWSDFLSSTNAEWREKIGTGSVVEWPAGVAATGNEGVASSVQRTRVSIGYVEYAYAKQHNLSDVSVRNRDGFFVRPGKASFEAAAMSARWQRASDLSQVLVDEAGSASWPITGASFIIVPKRSDDACSALQTLRFFDWAFRRGRTMAAALDYVPIPPSAVEAIVHAWGPAFNRQAGADPCAGAH